MSSANDANIYHGHHCHHHHPITLTIRLIYLLQKAALGEAIILSILNSYSQIGRPKELPPLSSASALLAALRELLELHIAAPWPGLLQPFFLLLPCLLSLNNVSTRLSLGKKT